MKRASIILVIIVGIAISSPAFAGAESGCYAYGDANALVYCLRALQQRGAIRAYVPASNTYTKVSASPSAKPTNIVHTSIVGYQYTPVARPTPPSDAARIISAIGQASSGMMMASAWAYNWRHGYVGGYGIYNASYLMNYPW